MQTINEIQVIDLYILAGFIVLPVVVSYLVEALRPEPVAPKKLNWAPEIPIRTTSVNGVNLRYIETGEGAPLVLLHTLRTQLDMFQKVIPELSRHFRVIALDYPGHGFSDIPRQEYSADFFVETIAAFLEEMNIENAVVAGESIGGSIALLLAARHNRRVKRVIAINPYDYAAGAGLRRSSWLANLIFGLNNIPILGATFQRLRMYMIVRQIFLGGVFHKDAFPPQLLKEMNAVGNRAGHLRALMSLVRHWPGWEKARAEYGKIEIPALLLYGDHDWSRPGEREANLKDIPGAKMTTVKDSGHFMSVDAPADVTRAILEMAET